MEHSPMAMDSSPEPYQFTMSGFPFDDMPRRQDIRSHLEDLAQRHPEFADQLRCPPWGGEMSSPSQGTRSRTRQGSSGDGGIPSYHPSEQEQADEPGPLRGRARQNNLPQHGLRNTVDLGQQQHEAEQEKSNRGQRSMSAPPDNRSADQPQRYVSRIDVNPLNPGPSSAGDGKPPVAPKQQSSKPAQQGTSNVRHIPIFVEGRDEPVIPKNVDSAPENIFTERVIPSKTSFTSERVPPCQSPFGERVGRPQSPFAERVIPTQTAYSSERVPPAQPSFGFNRPSQFTSQQQFQPSSVPSAKSSSFPKKQQDHEQPAEEQQQQSKLPPQPPKAAPKAPEPNDPMSRVQAVQNEVDELATKVESFEGNSRKDKNYVYLDEMLTRNLLKLDNVETEGKDNVRQARKSVIRNIQRCISILESKVPVPEELMEVEASSGEVSQEPESFSEKVEENVQLDASTVSEENKMEQEVMEPAVSELCEKQEDVEPMNIEVPKQGPHQDEMASVNIEANSPDPTDVDARAELGNPAAKDVELSGTQLEPTEQTETASEMQSNQAHPSCVENSGENLEQVLENLEQVLNSGHVEEKKQAEPVCESGAEEFKTVPPVVDEKCAELGMEVDSAAPGNVPNSEQSGEVKPASEPSENLETPSKGEKKGKKSASKKKSTQSSS